MLSLKLVCEPIDDGWCPPVRYSKESADNIVAYWRQILLRTTGKVPEYSGYAMRTQARKLLVEYSYKDILRALAFMGTPKSKYYQYSFSVAKIADGVQELRERKQNGKLFDHCGFIGPTKITMLVRK